MSNSGESDTESTYETNVQSYKCHICNVKPDFITLVHILQQIVSTGAYLVTLPNGDLYVRCQFQDCERYYHIRCIHPTFPDESLNYAHNEELRENGIHCPKCEPGLKINNY